jgi:hypothetical protein
MQETMQKSFEERLKAEAHHGQRAVPHTLSRYS